MFTIADLSTVWVLAGIYEQDIAGIAIGQKAKMRITARPGEEIEGTVSFVYPTVSEQTRTLNVRLQFPNPGLRLKPGMFAEVELERGSEPVLAVPSEAVMDGGEMQYAFVVHDGRHFIPHRVAIGRASDDWIEVLSGLQEGDEVVTSANFLIDSESRLKAAVAGMSGAGAHAGHGH